MAQAATPSFFFFSPFFILFYFTTFLHFSSAMPLQGLGLNITIDDNGTDPVTGREIAYAGNWALDTNCDSCFQFSNSWHISTSDPTQLPPLASIQFEGTAVYVNCVVPPADANVSGISDLWFYVDDELQANYLSPFPPYGVPPGVMTVFSMNGLTEGNHSLRIQNGFEGSGLASLLLLDSIVYTPKSFTVSPASGVVGSISPSPTPSPPAPSVSPFRATASFGPRSSADSQGTPTTTNDPVSPTPTSSDQHTLSNSPAELAPMSTSSQVPTPTPSEGASTARSSSSAIRPIVITSVVLGVFLMIGLALFLISRRRRRRGNTHSGGADFLVRLNRSLQGMTFDQRSAQRQRNSRESFGPGAGPLSPSAATAAFISTGPMHRPPSPPPVFDHVTPPPPSFDEDLESRMSEYRSVRITSWTSSSPRRGKLPDVGPGPSWDLPPVPTMARF